MLLDIVEEDGIQGVTLLPKEVGVHLDAGLSKDANASAIHPRIGISGAHNHSSNAMLDNGLRAGRGLTVVAARLQGDVERSVLGGLCQRCKGIALGVEFSALLMIALADNATVPHDYGAYHGIGMAPALALTG